MKTFSKNFWRKGDSRYDFARKFFRLLQDAGITIVEPEIFKIELIGQLARRMKKDKAILVYKEVVERVEFVKIESIKELALSIAFDTGCRAIDSFYVSAAKMENAILVSNDKIQVENAKKYGIEGYYLTGEFDRVVERLKELGNN